MSSIYANYTHINPDDFEVSEAIKRLNYNIDYLYNLSKDLEKEESVSVVNIIPYTDFSIISNLEYWNTLDNTSKVFFQEGSLKVTSNTNILSLVSPIFSDKVEALQSYTLEGFQLFDNMLARIDKDISIYLLKSEIRQNVERKEVIKNKITNESDNTKSKAPKKVVKIGRNDLCPCGSGKKYKQCCGK